MKLPVQDLSGNEEVHITRGTIMDKMNGIEKQAAELEKMMKEYGMI